MESAILDSALEHLCNALLTTGRYVKSKSSPKDSWKGSSEKESLALLLNRSRAKQNLKLLEAHQKLERAQAEEDYLRAKETCELSQASDVLVSNLGKIIAPNLLTDTSLCIWSHPFRTLIKTILLYINRQFIVKSFLICLPW